MSTSYFLLPAYIEDIAVSLANRGWIVHSFNTDNSEELYNPSNYLHNSEFEGSKYTLGLDLNIYQFLLNSNKKKTPNDNYRDAAALLVFCQISNIEIDPSYAVYEKVNYEESNLDEALPDLELFKNINNSDTEKLAKYALGYESSYEIATDHKINHDEKREMLTKYRRLTEWDSLYLILLSIVDIKFDNNIPANKKLLKFLEWLICKFRMSLVGTIYAIVLFGKKPLKRMMKYDPKTNVEARKSALWNMTWDLYIMNQFFRKWVRKGDTDEFFFASDDKAFCELLRSAIKVQQVGDFSPLTPYLSKSGYEIAENFLNLDESSVERVYKTEQWSPDYRKKLIESYEANLVYRENEA
ncbi:hypothetical protein DFO83_111103 [Idiomarina loihiensis]|uniref:hypothetical protein n=1 Tax=Idiomarina TaxID=135575 RepID=UPI000D70E71C|nr:hypothetical protein [Idiomarina]PWW34576.1 hypothetical protein DFO83_111103 [Idiomarina loihiensis]TDP43712.1 hypothetical protein DET58_1189 [Idiomarina loihiensis]TDS18457.1 hypothetical protein DET62_1183 [Idiomarina sp. H2]